MAAQWSRGTALLAAPSRVGPIGAASLLGLLGRSLLLERLHLRMQLRRQLLVLRRELADPVDGNPVVPGILPTLVVNLKEESVAVVGRLDVEDLGLVEHLVVEAEHLLVLLEGLCGLSLAAGRHIVGGSLARRGRRH